MEANLMTIFVDAGIFVALRNAEDINHQRSKELMMAALKGNFGRIYTSDYIIDEAITTALARTKRHDVAVDVGTYILDSPRFIKIAVDTDVFNLAWLKFKTFKGKGLSFTDCTSIALTEKQGIKQILSFDCGFDGIVQRIC
jgi:predicted nucleic acid-binding protein